MSKEASPSFQFFPKDFLADENVALMTMAERGVYITLLCFCWTEGSVPSSIQSIARLCSMSSGSIKKMWPTIQRCFVETDNRFRHKRLDAEREKQAAWRNKLAESGRKGGLSRDQASLKHTRMRAPLESEGRKEQSEEFDLETAWLEFHEIYPAKGRSRQIDAKGFYVEILMVLGDAARDKHIEIMKLMRDRWLPSDKWARGFVMREDEFIRQESWNETPEPSPQYAARMIRETAAQRETAEFESRYRVWEKDNPGKTQMEYADWCVAGQEARTA